MSDFFDGLFDRARVVANEVLDKLEQQLAESNTKPTKPEPVIGYKKRYEDALYLAARLEEDIDALSEELEEARLALKLLLDGETSKTFVVSDTRADALADYAVETFWLGESGKDNVLVVRQRKL